MSSPGNGGETFPRAPTNEVCACLLETGTRQVEIVERCTRCGLCMDSDAYTNALAEMHRYRDALERIYRSGRGLHVEIARDALNA